MPKSYEHEYEPYSLPRGTLTEAILNALSGGAAMAGALFESALGEVTNFSMESRYNTNRGSSGGGVDLAASHREFKSFSALLSKLKRDGFVESAGSRRKFFWRITRRGEEKLAALLERASRRRPEAVFTVPASDGKLRIVTYDISERERTKRVWLREALTYMEYELLQRSVWIGKRPLPQEFFAALRRQGIFTCVHLIEVGKSGTIRQTA